MKFVVSNTLLLQHLQAISRLANKNNTSLYADSSMAVLCNKLLCNTDTDEFNFNEAYNEYNFLLKFLAPYNKELRISKYEKEPDNTYEQGQVNFHNNEIFNCDEEKIKLSRLVNFESYLSSSVKQLQHQLAIYTGLLQSTLFRVLRHTRIHTLSIFFGLCCSSSGYIFNAITGTCSHPIPSDI